MKRIFLFLFFMFSPVFAQLISSSGTKIFGVYESEGAYYGVAADLTVELHKGTGRVFVDTTPLTKIDTQASARLSKQVACETLKMNCSNYDFFYIIKSPVQMIGGPSGGAAMTTLTLVVLTNSTIKPNVGITGTINPDGSIGQIGAVQEKALSAREAGITTFLVPRGQAGFKVEDVEVNEVSKITDAFYYLTGNKIISQQANTSKVRQDYENIMQLMASQLMSYSESMLSRLEKASEIISDEELNQSASDVILASKDILKDASEFYNKSQYYSASSFLVQSSFNSVFGYDMINFENSNRSSDFIKLELYILNSRFNELEKKFTENVSIDCINDIELLATSISRLHEAESLLDNATYSFNTNDYESAVYYLSLSDVRMKTAEIWFSTLSYFSNSLNYNFSEDTLADSSQSSIERAQDAIIYADTLVTNIFSVSSHESFSNSLEAFDNKNYIYSIFESLQARALANLAMEVRALNESELVLKLGEKQEEALISIQEAESKGVLPILALSYLEYSKDLYEKGDIASALTYSAYSKEFSVLSDFLIQTPENSEKVSVERTYSRDMDLLTVLFIGGVIGFLLSKRL